MNGTTELDLWNLFQVANMSNGIQFLGIAFLAWVGLRISSSIPEFVRLTGPPS